MSDNPKKRILLVFAHPMIWKSRANKRLIEAARHLEGPDFEVLDLYESYPDFLIDVPVEQQRLLQADVILLQHPFYWYSQPALLKEWMDRVFEYGFAFGTQAKLAGKRIGQVITTGGTETSYRPEGSNHCSMFELLKPMEMSFELCKLDILPPFVLHNATKLSKEQLSSACERYRSFLRDLQADRYTRTYDEYRHA